MTTSAAPLPSASSPAPALHHVVLGDLEHELATTRRVIERVPDAHLAWKPHARSMSLGELAAHIVNIPGWATLTLTTDEMDFAAPAPHPPAPTTTAELVARLAGNVTKLRDALAGAGEDALRSTWTARRGAHVVFAMPRIAVLRGMIVNHMVHHRGQLSVYLRLLDVPVPPMYGPTADEGRP